MLARRCLGLTQWLRTWPHTRILSRPPNPTQLPQPLPHSRRSCSACTETSSVVHRNPDPLMSAPKLHTGPNAPRPGCLGRSQKNTRLREDSHECILQRFETGVRLLGKEGSSPFFMCPGQRRQKKREAHAHNSRLKGTYPPLPPPLYGTSPI